MRAADRSKFHAALRPSALALVVGLAAFGITPASAQSLAPPPPPPPSPTDLSFGNIHVSTASSLFDLSTRFLRHLGNEAAGSTTGAPLTNNPNGGGADMAVSPQAQQRWRSWFEGYGLWSRMSARDTFPGDRRSVWGGVAGLGYTPVPGMSFGASVDQSRTKIDVVGLPQNATIDLTQVGANASFEAGAWTLSTAFIHGFGQVDSWRNDTPGEIDTTSYRAKLWGALGEISYLWTSGNFRIVPKVGMDWARADLAGFTESGGPNAVTGSSQTSQRTRIFGGAEVGHTWNFDRALFDLSAYGRVVDTVKQDIGALQITGAGTPVSVQGVGESLLGADAGGAATLRLSAMTRLYAAYDGRFRSNFTSHSGTLGLELSW